MPSTGDRQKEQERAEAAEEEALRPLLARANLLRMRRQWDDAITACTDALRRAPNSANAHAMLGNIYEAQGKFEDAIEWYVMAKEIRPLSTADAAQLEHLLDVQRVRLRTDEISNTIPIDQKPAAEKTLEWFDRIFPPGRSDGLTRLILAMSVGIAIVIAICAALIYFYVSPKREEAIADAAQVGMPDTLISSTPIIMTPSLPKSAASPAANASPLVSPASATPSSGHSLAPDASTVDIRTKVAQALEGGGASISSLTTSPGMASIALDLALPAVKSESTDHLRERGVRLAGLAARAAALSAPETLQKIILRLGLDTSSNPLNADSGSVQGHGGAVVIFVGTAPLKSFRDSNVAGLPTSDLLARFETVQWYAALAPNVTTPSNAAQPASGSSSIPSPSPAAGAPVGTGAASPAPSPAATVPPSPPPTS